MSGEYTDEEVKERLGQVLDQTISIDRKTFSSADFIIDSLKALVGKALNSEVDAFYYFVKLFTTGQSKKCQKALTYLDEIERFSFIGNQEISLGDPSKLEDILDVLESMIESETLAEVANHNVKLANHVKLLVNGSRREDGSVYTGYNPAKAKQNAIEALANFETTFSEIHDSAYNYLDAPANHERAELSRYPLVRLAQESKRLFTRYIAETTQDDLSQRFFGRYRLNLLDAIRDITLISSVVDRRSTKVDLDSAKYDSSVTTVGKNPALLQGDTLPFSSPIYQGSAPPGAGGKIHIKIDGLYEDDVTSEYAPPPVMNLLPPLSKLMGVDQGRFALGDGVTNTFESGVNSVPFLKTYVPKELLEVQYEDVFGQMHIIEYDNLVAQAFVDLEDPTNTFAVTLVEDEGKLTLDFSAAGAKIPGSFKSIIVRYRYYIIYDYSVRDSQGALVPGVLPYNKFSAFFQNTLTAYILDPTKIITDSKTLWAEVGSALTGDLSITDITAADVAELSSATKGGSGVRVALPNYTTNMPSLNTSPFAPTWNTGGSLSPPLDLNRALSIINSAYPPAHGKDIQLTDLTVGPALAGKLTLTSTISTVARGISGVATVADDDEVTVADTFLCLVGDTLEITFPYRGTTKITAITSSTVIEVDPVIALNFNPAGVPDGEVLAGTSITFDVTRNKAQVLSSDTSAYSSIEATLPQKGGFGFSGIALGTPKEVTLTSVSADKPIRAGDHVFEGTTKIGSVSSSSGTAVKLNIDLGVSYGYPFTDLRIESLGKASYYAQRTPVQNAALAATKLVEAGEYPKNIGAFVHSGAGVAHHLRSLSELRTAITDLKTAYDDYEANSVSEVDALVRTLNEEKLTLVLSYLRNLDFESVSTIVAEEVSKQSSVENLLEELSTTLGGNISYVEMVEGDSRLGDFFTRGDGDLSDFPASD